jgi:hypothetical protein
LTQLVHNRSACDHRHRCRHLSEVKHAKVRKGLTMPERKTVFVSYSHKNKRWLQRLRVHLTPYEQRGVVVFWDDSRIDPGDRWHSEIQRALDRAAAGILLISADFLASHFVVTHELPTLLRKAEHAGTTILPIIVEPCDLTIHPELAAFQALNSPREPLAAMSRADAEHVWVRAVSVIGKLFAVSSRAGADRRTTARGNRGQEPTGSKLFEQLQSASIAVAILWALGNTAAEFTLSELEEDLDIRSRKRAYEALQDFVLEGWTEKIKRARLTKYRLTEEGVRRRQRLAAVCDGPVRRGLSPG